LRNKNFPKNVFADAINKAVFPGLQGGPHENVIAAKAVAFKEALDPSFRDYARQIIANTQTLCHALEKMGCHIVFGTTQNHMILLDIFTSHGIGGKEAERSLNEAGLTVNKNVIPNDSRPPLNPSGIRLGTPAITTRGMKETEMQFIADAIMQILSHPSDESLKERIKNEVKELCARFPLYPDFSYS